MKHLSIRSTQLYGLQSMMGASCRLSSSVGARLSRLRETDKPCAVVHPLLTHYIPKSKRNLIAYLLFSYTDSCRFRIEDDCSPDKQSLSLYDLVPALLGSIWGCEPASLRPVSTLMRNIFRVSASGHQKFPIKKRSLSSLFYIFPNFLGCCT